MECLEWISPQEKILVTFKELSEALFFLKMTVCSMKVIRSADGLNNFKV
jgi:hypothetical protein